MSGDVTTLCGAESSDSDESGDYNGPKFDFSSHCVKDPEPSKEGPDFKAALLPYSYSYLGDMRDMPRCDTSALEPGKRYRLPFWLYHGPRFPGQVVPIRESGNSEIGFHEFFEENSQHPGLFAVLGWPYPLYPKFRMHMKTTTTTRGWVAQILQLTDDGKLGLVQVVGICTFHSWVSDTDITLLDDDDSAVILNDNIFSNVSIEVSMETCPAVASPDDLLALSEKALGTFRRNHPRVAQFEGDPLQVSYWLATHMPLPPHDRQRLLDEEPHTRLESIIELSSMYKLLQCGECHGEVADSKDLIQVVDQGPSLDCLDLEYSADPEDPEDSDVYTPISFSCFSSLSVGRTFPDPNNGPELCPWLPGYTKQGIYCNCTLHLGWVLTAWDPNMPIQKFYALRHVVIKHNHGRRFLRARRFSDKAKPTTT